jgi:hypothetical protein
MKYLIKKTVLLYSLLLSIVFFCSNCATSFPMQDARILPQGKKQIALGGKYLTAQDAFANPKKIIVDSAVPGMLKQFIYGSPIVSSFTFSLNKRYELGIGLLGVFQKWAILCPASDKDFVLSNVAITQTFNIGFAMYPGRFYGTETNGGVLAGMPISKSCYFTTGALARMCLNEILSGAGDTLKDAATCWQYGLVAHLEQIVIPINIIVDFPQNSTKSNSIRMCFGVEIPFDLKKTFTFEKFYANQARETGGLDYMEKNKIKLLLSLGYIF